MTAPRFAAGDRVVCTRPLPSGATVRCEGEVRQISGGRLLIRFDQGGQVWQMAHGVQRVEVARERPALSVVPPAPVPPVRTPARAADPLARLDAAGVDVVMVWREIGAGLRDRARRAIADADEAVRAAEGEVAAAESLLADARRGLAGAKARAEAARRELAIVERDLGVLR